MTVVGTDGGDGSGLLGAAALGHDFWLWTAHCKGGTTAGYGRLTTRVAKGRGGGGWWKCD